MSCSKPGMEVVEPGTSKTKSIPYFRVAPPEPPLVRASDLFKHLGTRVYDPGFTNTASCSSAITYIDGDQGVLRYRGYPIAQLAQHATFLEVSFLLHFAELPTTTQLDAYTHNIIDRSVLHPAIPSLISTFPRSAHPMAVLVSAVAAMGALHPDANPALQGPSVYKTPGLAHAQVYRIMGSLPTLAAAIYRHCAGLPVNSPPPRAAGLTYAERFLHMVNWTPVDGDGYRPDGRLARALDVLFTLHADHELNCSTATMRQLASSGVDVYTAVSGAVGALYGPLHGGANEAVLKMLEAIGERKNVGAFIQAVKARKAKLMGFGHRVYRHYDPRAKMVREMAYEVFDVVSDHDPLIDVARALEEAALRDEYSVSRQLYPNVDFYSGLIYKAMGFPAEFFTVLFAMGRVSGWLAHWLEYLGDSEQKIARPRQNYVGPGKRDFIPASQRVATAPTPQRTRSVRVSRL